MSNDNEIKKTTVDALVASVDHTFQDCEIFVEAGEPDEDGVVPGESSSIPMRRVTIMELLRLAKRFKSFGDALNKDEGTAFGLVMDAGSEAVAAFIAISAGKRGKEAVAFEQALQDKPDEVILPLAAQAARLTIGDEGMESFFTRLKRTGLRTGLIKPPKPETEKAVA
jgi:hypothetical protein